MNKSDLIEKISERTGFSKAEAKRALNSILDSLETALAKGDRVSLKGFGSFQTKLRASRKVKNLHTAEIIHVPAMKAPTFKPGKALKESVNPTGDGDEMMIKEVGKTEKQEKSESISKRPKVIAVTSGKGGTGKTNFTINMAIALAQRRHRVYVIDADLGTANIDVLLGMHCKYTINNLVDDKEMSLMDIIAEGPEGIRLIPGGSGLQSLAELPPDELGRIIGMLKPLEEHADILIVDTGSGISRNVVEFALAADEVVVVITPEPHSISDAYAIIKVLNSSEFCPPIKLVFNQVENINEAKLVSAKLKDVTERFLGFSPETIGHIVKDDNVVKAVKHFKPFVLYNPLAPASRCVVSIAEKLAPGAEDTRSEVEKNGAEEKTGFFGKLKNLFAKTPAQTGDLP